MNKKNRSLIEYLSAFMRLIIPFWKSKDSRTCRFLLFMVFVFSGLSVFIAKQVNTWYNDFYNTLQEYDLDAFWSEMAIFCVIATFHVYVAVTNAYVKQKIMIEWRHWLSTHFMRKWLSNGVFYKMQFTESQTDNPDQRIAADLDEFVSLTFSLTIEVLTSLAMLVTFFSVLWELSSAVDMTVGDMVIHLPDGYLCYLAVIYAAIGTVLTFIIGRPLIRLNFRQQRVEADYRFSLVRIRENAESIAMYRGTGEEGVYLEERFGQVVKNVYNIMLKTVHVGFFSLSYNQASVVFPFIISSPLYFAKTITLGSLIQISSAFGRVQDSLSTLINNFASLARWKSVIDRLVQYNENMEAAAEITSIPVEESGTVLTAEGLSITTPEGRQLMLDGCFQLKPGDAMLIRGPSGCGKTTLFRTLAGLWPYATGRINYPVGEVLFLSQKPYIPLGTLRRAICYPHAPLPDHVILKVMEETHLEHLVNKLDLDGNWGQILSLGEQQRVAFARAILLHPQIIFMDEASSAMDEDLENRLYTELRRHLTSSIIVSVGHRSTLKRFHNCCLEWAEDLNWSVVDSSDYAEDGNFTDKDVSQNEHMDDESFERYRTGRVYSKDHSEPVKPSLLRRLLMHLGKDEK
jgi:putative ATP-binding cassette transporter